MSAQIFVTQTQRGQPCLVIEGRRYKQRKGPADDPRTTNAVEGFHHGYNDKFNGAHPNIHVSIDIFQDYQASTYVKMNSIKKTIPGRVRQDVVRRVAKAVEAFRQFSNGERSMFSYLKYMGFLVKKKH